MARVLFDKNVPYLLRRCLKGHQAQTADDEGWGQISNGELIGCAEEAGYQIIVTFNAKIPQIVAACNTAARARYLDSRAEIWLATALNSAPR